MTLKPAVNRYTRLSGALFFVGAVQFLLLLLTSTALYPNYNVNHNYISDLGATCRPPVPCFMEQPSSLIFNSSTFIFGLLSALGFCFLLMQSRRRVFAYLGLITSIGAMGVGLFTEEVISIHAISALIAFVGGGLTAITVYRFVRLPFSAFSVAMGVISLVFLGLFIDLTAGNLTSSSGRTLLGLGIGALERLLVYPIALWEVGFGAYLMNTLSDLARS